MIVILLGAPGSGKGTQSMRLAAKYGFTHLATGDVFRAEIAQGTDLGKKAQDYVKSGKLVPDNIVTEMVAARLDPKGQFLLDGFPRNIDQAQALDSMLKKAGASVNLVCSLALPTAEAIRRMSSRRICSNCAEVYNTISRPTKVEGVCDKCGGKVIQREDDTETTAAKRLMVFEDLTHPLVAYYRAEQVFHEIDAAQPPEKVEAALSTVIASAK
ncbi:MAG: adenylate kinase [Elusimicrobia bacterium]|nr:adenylate kinase [Elusimicrobiota bacterium]MDE2510013.1 adenylate kinase [Elusimicrobiota bacterium]